MPSNRPKLPLKIETEVVTRSKRRCCLCVGLQGDFNIKRIQIAHIDHNNSNNKSDNLVALCLLHHDEYDEQKSQSKGITKNELKYYRSELDKIVQKIDEQVKFTVIDSSKPNELSYATPSAKIVGQVLEAFDREIFVLDNGNSPRGIALARIARFAIEEGEFDAALEAFLSIVRLAYLVRSKNWTKVIDERDGIELKNEYLVKTPSVYDYPEANINNSALQVLKTMAQTDQKLFQQAVSKASEFGFWGNVNFTSFSGLDSLPNDAFGAVFTILVAGCHYFSLQEIKWAEKCIAERLVEVYKGLGYALNEGGIELPNPPEKIYMSISGDRWISEEQHRDLLPLISLAYAIATLPKSSFIYGLERLKYFITGFFPTENISPDGNELSLLLKSLDYHAVYYTSSIILYSFKSKSDMKIFNTRLEEVNNRGNQINLKLAQYLIRENKLTTKTV